MSDLIATASVSMLIVVSMTASLLYLPRVRRHADDAMRWALFGMLLSLALTNAPVLFAMKDVPLPLWVGALMRVLATIVLIVVVWPLVRDSWRESCAWVRVARDSWRLFRDQDR